MKQIFFALFLIGMVSCSNVREGDQGAPGKKGDSLTSPAIRNGADSTGLNSKSANSAGDTSLNK